MKAIVFEKYGPPDVVRLKEVDKPLPKENEVLVKVLGTCVNYNILVFGSGKPFIARFWTGLLKPKSSIPGGDIAGVVEETGKDITDFKPGDKVMGELDGCGYGAYAEYVCVPERTLVKKPENISFNEAGTIPQASLVALQALRDYGRIKSGQKVLIYGASGGIGTFAVQIAKSYGAEVTGVCGPDNVEMVRAIGADHIIDYTKEDFASTGKTYDLILATTGYRTLKDYSRALSPQGIYVVTGSVMTGPKALAQIFEAMFMGPWLSKKDGKRFLLMELKESREDLNFIRELVEKGKVKPVIDRTYKLSEAAEALKYYARGHSRGKVAVKVSG